MELTTTKRTKRSSGLGLIVILTKCPTPTKRASPSRRRRLLCLTAESTKSSGRLLLLLLLVILTKCPATTKCTGTSGCWCLAECTKGACASRLLRLVVVVVVCTKRSPTSED